MSKFTSATRAKNTFWWWSDMSKILGLIKAWMAVLRRMVEGEGPSSMHWIRNRRASGEKSHGIAHGFGIQIRYMQCNAIDKLAFCFCFWVLHILLFILYTKTCSAPVISFTPRITQHASSLATVNYTKLKG